MICIILFPLAGTYLYDTMVSRIQETFAGRRQASYQVGQYNVQVELSSAARVDNWKRAFTEWIAKKPLLGFGVSGVGLVDTQYRY